jgi:glycosyltransferase involved in cell wall biosynthesis
LFDLDVDIYHAHSYWNFSTNFASFASKLKRVPIIITSHGYQPLKSFIGKFVKTFYLKTLGKFTLNNVNYMLLYHPQDKSILMRLGIPEANIELIPNAIDMDEFDPIMDASDIITKCDLGSTKQILFVGRLIKRKGCEFIVRAMPKILKEVPNTKFLIVGDGPEEDTIKKLINNLGIEDSVIMFGYVKPLGSLIKKIYKSSDLLVLPSLDECMSRTILEAMSMKLPIITTKNWYSEWLVQPNKEAALLVNPYNITMLADAIIKILTDDELSKNLAEKGRYLIETAYNWKIIAKRTINLYEKCIKRTQKHF